MVPSRRDGLEIDASSRNSSFSPRRVDHAGRSSGVRDGGASQRRLSLDGFAAVARIGEAVVGARDDVQAPGARAARSKRSAPVRGRHHLVAVGPGSRGRARRRRAPRPASPRAHLGDQGRARPSPRSASGSSRSDGGRVPGHDRQRRAPARAAATQSATKPPRLEPSSPKRPSSSGRVARCSSTASRSAMRVSMVASLVQPARLAAAAEVEARERQARPRAARGRAAGTCRCPWRRPCRGRRRRRAPGRIVVGQVQHAGHVGGADGHAEALARSRPDEVEERGRC